MADQPIERIYSTREAAEYVGLSIFTLRHHIFERGDLIADTKKGNRLLFTRQTLDRWKKTRLSGGRPRKPKSELKPESLYQREYRARKRNGSNK